MGVALPAGVTPIQQGNGAALPAGVTPASAPTQPNPADQFRAVPPLTTAEWWQNQSAPPWNPDYNPSPEDQELMRFVTDPEGHAAERQAITDQAEAVRQQWLAERADRPLVQRIGDWTRAALQGLTWGSADEILGFLAGMEALLRGGDYDAAREYRAEYERQQHAAFQQENPVGAIATELVGAVATGLPGGAWAARGQNIASRFARGGVVGGTEAALYGAGTAEGGAAERLAGAANTAGIGAGIGAAIPLAAPIIARGAGAIYNTIAHPVNTVRLAVQGATRPAPGVIPAQRTAQAAEFDIPLTRGQTTGNTTQQAREEALLQGTRGDAAQQIMQSARNSQNEAIQAAATRIGADISGASLARMVPASEAGEITLNAVRRAAEDLRTNAQMLYQRAEDINPTISANSADFLPQNVAYHLVNGTDFTLSAAEHPTAFRALRLIDGIAETGQMTNPTLRYPSTTGTGIVPLTELMRVRRQINALTGVNPADSQAIREVRNAFDRAIKDLFDEQMFSGDPRAIQAWQGADFDYSRFRAMTNPKPGDAAGRIISRIIDQDVTPQQMANWLYGTNVVAPPQTSASVARSLRELFGETSEEWNAIRAGMWSRLVTQINNPEEMLTAGQIAKNITGFVTGRGASLAATLFTPAERDLMRRYANTLRLLIPDAEAMNPSRSGYRVMQMLRPLSQGISVAVGGMLGNWGGAVLASIGQPMVRNLMARVSATRATIFPLGAQPLIRNPATATRVLSTVLGTANTAITPRALQ